MTAMEKAIKSRLEHVMDQFYNKMVQYRSGDNVLEGRVCGCKIVRGYVYYNILTDLAQVKVFNDNRLAHVMVKETDMIGVK
jgi:hypothetical protein